MNFVETPKIEEVRIRTRPKFKLKPWIKLCGGVIVVLALASVGYFLFFKDNGIEDLANLDETEELESIVERVERLAIVPKGEDPTLATVSDPLKLSDQDFFKEAEVGDKVLIYGAAKKVVLYRPQEDKIVNIASIVINQNP